MKGFRLTILFALLGLLHFEGKAQIDSLEEVLSHTTNDSARMVLLSELGWQYHQDRPRRAEGLVREAVNIAQQNRYQSGLAIAYAYLGNSLYEQAKFDSAIHYFRRQIALDSIMDEGRGVAIGYQHLSLTFKRKGEFPSAMHYALKSLDWLEAAGEEYEVAAAKVNTAPLFMREYEYDQAIRLCQEALDYYRAHQDSMEIAVSCGCIGNILDNMNRLDEAIVYHDEALAIYRILEDVERESDQLMNIGLEYIIRGKKEEALRLILQAWNLIKDGEDPYSKAVCKLNVGAAYTALGAFDEATASFMESLALADSVGSIELKGLIHQHIAETYADQERYDLAYPHAQAARLIGDTVYNETKGRQLAEFQEAYEAERREREIAMLDEQAKVQALQLEAKDFWIYLLLAVIAIVVLGAFSWSRITQARRRQSDAERELRKIELQHQALQMQMNPHFIFNALIAIQSYNFEHDTMAGNAFLVKFSKLMRQVLEKSREEVISLEEELEILEHYLSLQQLRFEDVFTYEIEIDPAIKVAQVLLPPFLIQPLLENAIEHGVSGRKSEGLILMSFKKDGEQLRFTIRDNGKGRAEAARKVQKKRQSIALDIIKNRLALLNPSNRADWQLRVVDLEEGDTPTGTEVSFCIPLVKKNAGSLNTGA